MLKKSSSYPKLKTKILFKKNKSLTDLTGLTENFENFIKNILNGKKKSLVLINDNKNTLNDDIPNEVKDVLKTAGIDINYVIEAKNKIDSSPTDTKLKNIQIKQKIQSKIESNFEFKLPKSISLFKPVISVHRRRSSILSSSLAFDDRTTITTTTDDLTVTDAEDIFELLPKKKSNVLRSQSYNVNNANDKIRTQRQFDTLNGICKLSINTEDNDDISLVSKGRRVLF